MAKIEGNTSHLAGRIMALRNVYKFSVDLPSPEVVRQALSPGGPVTKALEKREDDLENEAPNYQDAEAFRKGYEEEFDKAMELLRSPS